MATTSVGTVRAILQDAYGTSDVWRVGNITVPDVADKEVLVKVEAAGLDRGTWHLMTGLPYLGRLVFGLRRPKNPVPGRDLAGTVVAVGAAVTRFGAGDAVFGIGSGSFAEYAVALEDKLARAPANLTSSQAAAVPISGTTALRALRDTGRLEQGRRVLIIGASGGVGTYAVQLAKALGAHVTGVCSTAKIDLVRSLGADRVIDYTRDDFADGAERYDLVIDIGGSSSLSRLRRAVNPEGTLVIVGGEGGGTLTGMRRQLPLTVPATTAHRALPERALHRSGTTHCVHRRRYRHPVSRPQLPTRSSGRSDAATDGRRGARQDHHHHLKRARPPSARIMDTTNLPPTTLERRVAVRTCKGDRYRRKAGSSGRI